MQLLVIQFTIYQQLHFLNICVTSQTIDYKLPEDDTIVSEHVGV